MTTPTSRHAAHSPPSSGADLRHDTSHDALMRAKKSSRSLARHASGSELASWSVLTELGRKQLAVATEGASALYRATEALRKVEQETAHEASLRHAQVARKLLSPCQPADILALQAELVRSNMKSAAHYWLQFMAVASQTQRELMLSMTHLTDSEPGNAMKPAAFQSVIAPMATSFFAHHASNEPH